jgi:hypothetical protein
MVRHAGGLARKDGHKGHRWHWVNADERTKTKQDKGGQRTIREEVEANKHCMRRRLRRHRLHWPAPAAAETATMNGKGGLRLRGRRSGCAGTVWPISSGRLHLVTSQGFMIKRSTTPCTIGSTPKIVRCCTCRYTARHRLQRRDRLLKSSMRAPFLSRIHDGMHFIYEILDTSYSPVWRSALPIPLSTVAALRLDPSISVARSREKHW